MKEKKKIFNYNVYLKPTKTWLNGGDTLYVDVMLAGNINYTQIMAEVTFESGLLQFAGYENLNGWVAACSLAGSGKVTLRSVPSSNMTLGASCSTAVRLVTLKFTAKDGFAAYGLDTRLAIGSIMVSPPAGYIGATTAPGETVAITLYKPVNNP